MRRYIGLDPALNITGLVALDSEGSVLHAQRVELPKHTVPKSSGPLRLVAMYTAIEAAVRALLPPGGGFTLALEEPLLRGNGALWRAGLFGLLVWRWPAALMVNPTQTKRFASGDGAADKDKVAAGVRACWQYENDSDDIVDAYALARLAHAHGENIGGLLLPYQRSVLGSVEAKSELAPGRRRQLRR